MTSRAMRRALLFSIFAINALGLVFQVLWVRQVGLVGGTTALSISVVLSVFLAGIALGAQIGARWIRRRDDGLRLAAWLVIATGLACFVSPYALRLVPSVAGALFGAAPALQNGVRLALCALVLLVPTSLIGSLFPVAVHLCSSRFRRLGRDVSSIYSLDVLGGAVGALAAGHLLVPVLGLSLTSAASAGLYVLLGLALLGLSHRTEPRAEEAVERQEPARESPPDIARRVVLLAVLVTGFAGLLLEVTWARFFHLHLGTSLYAVSLVLGAFLVGLAAGAAVIGRFLDRLQRPLLVLACIDIAVAGCCLPVLFATDLVEYLYFEVFYSTDSFFLFQSGLFLVAAFLTLVPAVLMGAGFPVAVRVYARGLATRQRDAARVFAVNCAGGVLGALTAGFFFIPQLGIKGASFAASGLFAAVSVSLFVVASRRASGAPRHRSAFPALALVSAGLAIATFSYAREPAPVLSAYDSAVYEASLDAHRTAASARRVLFSRQGLYGLVSVDARAGYLVLRNNGKADASTLPRDMWLQSMLAHLPLLHHRRPERVLNIGLGAGLTLAAINSHPRVRKIDVVEIDPLVVTAVERCFSKANGEALADPRVRVTTTDGRSFVATTEMRYDLVISEPPNIWVSGVSGLFTREFYRAVRERLRPGGLLSQWVPGYEMSRADLAVIIDTIRTELPYLTMWSRNEDVVLVASQRPIVAEDRVLRAIVSAPSVQRQLVRLFDSPRSLGAFLEAPERVFSASTPRGDRLNTDDLPLLEFSTLKNRFYALHRRRGVGGP